ncbi:MAG: hypothetical protein KQI81_10605 [Deltaproteobacteria bacterium]|nr:hypothetical protein [Deltaproteobacteria bacterium]
MTARATLVLANHRPETISAAQRLMARYDTLILEEPPDSLFMPMLTERMAIDTYLETQDVEYPEFSRRMAIVLRELHRAGTRLYQIEPFIGHLLAIHERFAEGDGPSDLPTGTALHRVYLAEREATAALIDFYNVSTRGTFAGTLEAIKQFARSDAKRFALRDQMRAAAMVDVIKACGHTYIEAGPIHFPLWHELKRRLPSGYQLGVHFLMADAVRSMGYNDHLYGPGDILTLHYRFHPGKRFQEEDLLAARALIYNKLITKEEMINADEPYPHTRDELEVGTITALLSLTDCGRLYPPICRASTSTAREMVQHYLRLKTVPQ